jgi:ketosteroid isomerase-like protein
MSSENLEVVRRLIEANRSDDLERAIDTAVALCDPGVEFTSVMAAVEPETYHGHDGIRRYFSELAESWDEWRMDLEEVFSADPNTAVAVFRSHLIGKDSRATVGARRAMVCCISQGKLIRGEVYSSREEALRAVGLPN